MLISELIKKLQQIQNLYGDLEILYLNDYFFMKVTELIVGKLNNDEDTFLDMTRLENNITKPKQVLIS